MFDLERWAPSEATARFVEHFWSVAWDLRAHGPFDSTVITFPSMHITHEWGDDGPRHGYPLPNTLVHGVVERVFRTTISERGRVVGARFRPGGFAARFGRDAAALTARVVPVDDELFGGAIHLDDDVSAAGGPARRTDRRPQRRRRDLRGADIAGRAHPRRRPATPGGPGDAAVAVERTHHTTGVPPHFINDFRAMLGSTPGEYAAAHGR
jgi:hypothetical protein